MLCTPVGFAWGFSSSLSSTVFLCARVADRAPPTLSPPPPPPHPPLTVSTTWQTRKSQATALDLSVTVYRVLNVRLYVCSTLAAWTPLWRPLYNFYYVLKCAAFLSLFFFLLFLSFFLSVRDSLSLHFLSAYPPPLEICPVTYIIMVSAMFTVAICVFCERKRSVLYKQRQNKSVRLSACLFCA